MSGYYYGFARKEKGKMSRKNAGVRIISPGGEKIGVRLDRQDGFTADGCGTGLHFSTTIERNEAYEAFSTTCYAGSGAEDGGAVKGS